MTDEQGQQQQEIKEQEIQEPQEQKPPKTPFDYLNEKNYDELKKYLKYRKRDQNGRTLLHIAVLNNDIEAVKMLRTYLRNYRDYQNKTACYYAFQQKQKEVYELLKDYEDLI